MATTMRMHRPTTMMMTQTPHKIMQIRPHILMRTVFLYLKTRNRKKWQRLAPIHIAVQFVNKMSAFINGCKCWMNGMYIPQPKKQNSNHAFEKEFLHHYVPKYGSIYWASTSSQNNNVSTTLNYDIKVRHRNSNIPSTMIWIAHFLVISYSNALSKKTTNTRTTTTTTTMTLSNAPGAVKSRCGMYYMRTPIMTLMSAIRKAWASSSHSC
mmetsp:Transcript_23182/g.37123  ORF Transcript_23182/g.37123 Transcript_23182/m.37123 type:complete len:210 (+) Transcript_23182:234-863(+)